jgi:tetratricopeptide (TPR) repeat protein
MQRWWVGALLGTLLGACGPPRAPAVDPELAPPSADEVTAEYRAAARAAFARGVFLDAKGDVLGALHEYAQAVRLLPSDGRMRATYAQRLVDAGRVGDAASFLRGAGERFQATSEERFLLAQIDFLSGRAEPARRGVEALLAADSTHAEAWELRGRLDLQADRPADAVAALDRAARLQPPSTDLDLVRAESLRRLDRDADAEALLRRRLESDPERLDARRQLASLLREGGRRDEAVEILGAARAANPDDPDAIEATLEAMIESKDLAGAAAMLEPYHAAGALGPRLAYLYGRVLLQLDRAAAADSVLRPLAALEGVHGVEPLLGDIAVRLGRADAAREHYRRAMEQRPDDCGPAASLALLELQARRRGADSTSTSTPASPPPATDREIDAALAAAERTTGDDDYRCHLLLGLAYSAARRFEDALPHLEATRRLDPESSDAMFNLAMAHQELGHHDVALDLARALLVREPENAAAMNFVGYALAERGRELPESERLVRAALARDPDNGYYVDSLGWVLYQKGEYVAAAVELERAVRLTGERDALILEHLGDAYVRIGRLADAHRTYVQSRDLDPERTPLAEKIARVESQLRRP